jgi:hypothetical protein
MLSEKVENKKPSTEHNLKANAIFLGPNKKKGNHTFKPDSTTISTKPEARRA